MDFLKYGMWPWLKVRLTYWRWIAKYGGKKNIPKELIFGRMLRSMERMNENLMNALRTMSPNATEEEKKELIAIIQKAKQFEKETKGKGLE